MFSCKEVTITEIERQLFGGLILVSSTGHGHIDYLPQIQKSTKYAGLESFLIFFFWDLWI